MHENHCKNNNNITIPVFSIKKKGLRGIYPLYPPRENANDNIIIINLKCFVLNN